MRRAVFLFLLFWAPRAFGQSNYAVVSGTVTDAHQGPVAGAAVVLTSNETHAERRVTTNSQGIFQITGIMPGEYNLSVTASDSRNSPTHCASKSASNSTSTSR